MSCSAESLCRAGAPQFFGQLAERESLRRFVRALSGFMRGDTRLAIVAPGLDSGSDGRHALTPGTISHLCALAWSCSAKWAPTRWSGLNEAVSCAMQKQGNRRHVRAFLITREPASLEVLSSIALH